MSKIKIIIIFIVFACGLNLIFAQVKSDKIVCINTSDIIQKMPEFNSAQKKLKRLTEIYDVEFHKILKTFQKKSQQYEKEASYKKPFENKKRGEELILLKNRAEEYQKKISDNLEKKQNELLIPIYKKLENAIIIVVNQKSHVIRVDDCSPGKGILINRGPDITNDVLKILIK